MADVYSTVNRPSDQINQPEQEVFYDTVDSSINISTSKNEAYGKFANSTTEVPHSNINVKDPLTTQNVAYGEVKRQSPSPRVTGTVNFTSIPTTRNEAYTSVSMH